VNADDLLEARVGAEAERQGAARIEIARPAFDDAQDDLVRLTPDELHGLLARDAPQRLDLLADGGGDAGHGEVSARAELFSLYSQ